MASRVIVDRGNGQPTVLLPGIQGRWEWMEPAVQALSRRSRVLTFSLNDIPIPGFFDECVGTIDRALDSAGADRGTIVGVSFGGLVAACYAARRPQRTRALVLVSAPAPNWPLDPNSMRYLRRPRMALPAFAIRAARRLAPEIMAALPDWPSRARFGATHLVRTVRAPVQPTRMVAWVHAWRDANLGSELSRVIAPTLLITGEPSLDRVVPVSSTLQYLQLIRGARHHILERTGHVGLLLRPAEFARVVSEFTGHAASDVGA